MTFSQIIIRSLHLKQTCLKDCMLYMEVMLIMIHVQHSEAMFPENTNQVFYPYDAYYNDNYYLLPDVYEMK